MHFFIHFWDIDNCAHIEVDVRKQLPALGKNFFFVDVCTCERLNGGLSARGVPKYDTGQVAFFILEEFKGLFLFW